LGRLPKCPKERLPHAFPVTESCLARNDLDRVTARLHHKSRRLHAKPFDGFGRGLAGLLAENSAKLARTQPCGIRQHLDREITAQIISRIGQLHLHAVRLRVQLQQRRKLGLSAATPLIFSNVRLNRHYLNITALTRLSNAGAPIFARKGSGTIINIASVVGIAVEMQNGVYSASKSYVLRFGHALQRDLDDARSGRTRGHRHVARAKVS
jgi:hypothetical protein